MHFTKHAHATVVLAKGSQNLVVDPGAYTPNSAELVAATSNVLVTHDHADHFDAGILNAALARDPQFHVYAPRAVTEQLTDPGGQVTAVADGDSFTAAGFAVTVHGDTHAVIHSDIPSIDNVGFLFDATVFHPGDSYYVPPIEIETLLVPTSGPWAKLSESVEFVRGVNPKKTIQVHDLMLSDAGRGSFAEFIGALTGLPLVTLELGETITL